MNRAAVLVYTLGIGACGGGGGHDGATMPRAGASSVAGGGASAIAGGGKNAVAGGGGASSDAPATAGSGGRAIADVAWEGEWATPEIVSHQAHDGSVLAVGACGDGDVLIAFGRDIVTPDDAPPEAELYVTRYAASSSRWTSPVKLTEGPDVELGRVMMAVNASCEALLAWPVEHDSQTVITGAAYDGQAWADAIPLTDPVSAGPDSVHVGLSDDGYGVVVYASDDQLLRVDYTNAGFSEAVVMNDDTTPVRSVLLAMLADGRAIIHGGSQLTWVRPAGGVFGPGPALGSAQIVRKLNLAGDGLIALASSKPYVGTFAPGDAIDWLPEPSTFTLYDVSNAAGGVVAGNAGSVFYATRNSEGPGFEIARYGGAEWSNLVSVGDDSPASAYYDLFVEAAGRALSYYQSRRGTFVANRYQPDEGWSAPLVVAHSDIILGHSFAAMDAHGNAVIAWPGIPDKEEFGISAVRFTAAD